MGSGLETAICSTGINDMLAPHFTDMLYNRVLDTNGIAGEL